MVPVPQEKADIMPATKPRYDDSIVISGLSGCFPSSIHIEDFDRILYNKLDPVKTSDPRWVFNSPEVPQYTGTIPELDNFDAQFFKVNDQLANVMDPMSRKLKEHVYRAIYDAGLSADHLSGQNIGVYIGTSLSETAHSIYFNVDKVTASSLPGCSKAMFANRISYWLNLTGPSMGVDDLCASSMICLEQAYQAMKRGDCEAAIVAGASINVHPQTLIEFGRTIPLCEDGKTKAYDENADGCVKSEGLSVLFLQNKSDALRIYAEVVHVKNKFTNMEGETGQFGLQRNPEVLADFLEEFYKKAKVSPKEVEYFEGFGSGILDVDKSELKAAEMVLCKGRTNPLLVGSVSSNIGYTESATSVCSIAKVLLGYQKGLLAANLHCSNPLEDMEALKDGRMRILTEHAPFNRTYAAINGLSINGINGHALLRGNFIPKKPASAYKSSIARLVTISGRNESAVEKIIDDLSQRPIDPEELALLHNIHQEKNSGHLARGFVVLDENENGETVCLSKSAEYFDDMKRPLWFVYSGMGSQWSGMGKDLMRIPAFAAAIERCHKVLEPKGLDIKHIITSTDKTIFDNILHSFVGIAAVQIGLTDVLRDMGIVPDKIIGHSVGELGCGYADGCFTAEEMILSAYSRGLVSGQTKFIRGSMAAVGIGYKQAVSLCPPEIEVACHNGPESCTISGPADAMREFVAKLTEQGIFAKEVPCSNIAYHSRYIADAGPKLLGYLNEVIKHPKQRSERWVSTSVPQERWSEGNAQYCSAWYHTNNLLSPVLFEETSRLVEPGAVLVEVAPHGLLQAILKRSMHPDCRHIPLTKRGAGDGALYFLQAIGKFYMQGYQPKIKNLYPKVQFPVSTTTPRLSHLIEWNKHTCATPSFAPLDKKWASIKSLYVSTYDDEYNYLKGNVVRGKNLYPFSAALVAVWDMFAMVSGVARTELSVQFRDVHLFAQPILLDKRHLDLKVTIHKGTGEFKVVTSCSNVAVGTIREFTEQLPLLENNSHDKTVLGSDDIYKLFEERGYSYSGNFNSILKSNYSFTEAQLLWNDNWVTLIDGMLQLNSIRRDHDTVSQPSHIYSLTIDIKAHLDSNILRMDNKSVIATTASALYDYTKCGGILIEKVSFIDFSPLETKMLELETLDNSNINVQLKNKCDLILQSDEIGDLKSLSWVGTYNVSPSSSDNVVKVEYAGISVYDVNVATGVYSPKEGYLTNNVYGMEYSGTTNTGARVMGLVRGGAASSRVRAVPGLTWPAPAHWTLEDAATVPLAYACAFYCLGIKAKLYPGMTILVHGGAGALGQAVISIALAHQCKVFTTVSDNRKKKFLIKLFPDITEDVIGRSRDHSFADLVRLATNGKGCDIIISCTTGKLKNMTLECASFCGITFDVAQAHVDDTYSYGMHFMTKQRSYAQVNFFSIFESEEFMKTIQSMMSEGIARGYVKPLSRVTYAAVEATRAFRLLAASQHRGRVLLRLQDSIAPAQIRLACSPAPYQLVVCREENYSLQFVDRLIKRGARKILLHFNKSSPFIMYKIASWQNNGVEVKTSSIDFKNIKETQKLLDGIDLEGVFMFCPGDDQDLLIVNNLRQKPSPGIKKFVVISTKNSVKENCVKNQYPTKILSLEKLNNIKANNKNDSLIIKCNIIDTIERAICSPQRILNVNISQKPKPSLLKEIADRTGIYVPDNVKDETTLLELGLNNIFINAVGVILQSLYQISVPEEEIPILTVRSLKEFERHSREQDLVFPNGLDALISTVANNCSCTTIHKEHFGSGHMILLPTLAKTLSVNEDEVDKDQQYLWIVPGVEGHHERFRPLCAGLKLPALVLQPDCHPQETVHETAQRHIQVLKTRTTLKKFNDFYLIGYETGVLIAIEMAAILEKEGMTGTVFCVGGCPEEVLLDLVYNLEHLDTDEKLQNALFRHILSLVSSKTLGNEENFFENGLPLQEKIITSIQELLKDSTHTTLYTRALIEAVYGRIKQALHHEQTHSLKSRVILLRTKSRVQNKPVFMVDPLSKVPVTTYDLEVPLADSTEYPRSVSIINSHLKKEIVERFQAQNNCETYSSRINQYSLT